MYASVTRFSCFLTRFKARPTCFRSIAVPPCVDASFSCCSYSSTRTAGPRMVSVIAAHTACSTCSARNEPGAHSLPVEDMLTFTRSATRSHALQCSRLLTRKGTRDRQSIALYRVRPQTSGPILGFGLLSLALMPTTSRLRYDLVTSQGSDQPIPMRSRRCQITN